MPPYEHMRVGCLCDGSHSIAALQVMHVIASLDVYKQLCLINDSNSFGEVIRLFDCIDRLTVAGA